jgi:hypothetical protein
MKMNYEELDNITRQHMLKEFEKEQAEVNPYRPKLFAKNGISIFPDLIRDAINSGDDESLIKSLMNPDYWLAMEPYIKGGVHSLRRINIPQAAERLGLTEFNTWYVRGFAKRLIEEGIEKCQVYRGAMPRWEPAECSIHEGKIYSVQEIYDGHRARYWPEPGNPQALSIPFGPGCHHTIRRISNT